MGKALRTPYTNLTMQELRQWKGKKLLRLEKIRQYNSWFAVQEERRIASQLDALDDEIERRIANEQGHK